MIAHFLFRYRTVLFFALFVGSISVAPIIIAPIILGHSYKGVQYLPLDDEDIYRARITEILDGHTTVASPYLLEYKDTTPSAVVPINEWLYALPAMLLGLSSVILISKFLLPAILFIFVYLVTRRLVGNKVSTDAELLAIAVGLLVTLGYDFVDYAQMGSVVQGSIAPSPLVWTRLVNPIIGGIEVFGLLIALWALIQRRWRYTYLLVGGILALTVGYFFSFGISLAIVAVLAVLLLVGGEFRSARELGYAVLIAFVLDAGYWLHTLTAVGGEAGRALAMRNGMFFTHEPVINKMLLATTLFVAMSYAYARWTQKATTEHSHVWRFIAAILLGSWVAFNQQIITGREIWYHHFVQYVIPLCYVSILTVSYLVWREAFPRMWRASVIGIALVTLAYGAYSVTSYTSRTLEFQTNQDYAAVFSILDRAPKDCVALVFEGTGSLERLVPAYTHCNVYSTTYTFFGVPQERILHNYLFSLHLAGVAPKDARVYMLAHETEVRGSFFQDWKQLFGHGQDPWLLARVSQLDDAYQAFIQRDLKQELLQYRMDYLITEYSLPTALLRELSGLTLATSTGRYFLYSF